MLHRRPGGPRTETARVYTTTFNNKLSVRNDLTATGRRATGRRATGRRATGRRAARTRLVQFVKSLVVDFLTVASLLHHLQSSLGRRASNTPVLAILLVCRQIAHPHASSLPLNDRARGAVLLSELLLQHLRLLGAEVLGVLVNPDAFFDLDFGFGEQAVTDFGVVPEFFLRDDLGVGDVALCWYCRGRSGRFGRFERLCRRCSGFRRL